MKEKMITVKDWTLPKMVCKDCGGEVRYGDNVGLDGKLEFMIFCEKCKNIFRGIPVSA